MSTLAVTNIKHESATDNAIILSSNGSAEIRASSINSGPLAGFRNAIINGNFDIWQRGTSFSNPASGTYTADRWLVAYDGSGATRTISRQAFALGQTDVPGEPTYFFRFAQSVAGTGGTSSYIGQRIEGVRTFAGKQVTLSFYAKAAASLTMPLILLRQSFGTGGSPSSIADTYLLYSQAITTSWAKYTYTATLPSISGKTLGSDNNDYLDVILLVPVNTTFTFDLAQVQLEAGPAATPFERRSIGTELALCQRYYEKSYDQNIVPGTNSYLGTSYGVRASGGWTNQGIYKVTKRAIPTVTTYSPPNGTAARIRNEGIGGDEVSTVDSNGVTSFRAYGTSTTTGVLYSMQWTADAEL